jgi:hypothetical protein
MFVKCTGTRDSVISSRLISARSRTTGLWIVGIFGMSVAISLAWPPKFIQGTKDGYVEWGFTGVHTGDITEGISADDVGWLLRGLGSFTDKQIAAALRSSGAEEDEVSCFGNAIRDRIRQLKAVAAGPPS